MKCLGTFLFFFLAMFTSLDMNTNTTDSSETHQELNALDADHTQLDGDTKKSQREIDDTIFVKRETERRIQAYKEKLARQEAEYQHKLAALMDQHLTSMHRIHRATLVDDEWLERHASAVKRAILDSDEWMEHHASAVKRAIMDSIASSDPAQRRRVDDDETSV